MFRKARITVEIQGEAANMTGSAVTNRAVDNTVSAGRDTRLTGVLENLVSRGRARHVAVAISGGDGQQQWFAAAGANEIDSPPNAESPFFIASVTKRFIITLILQAHERGELDLSAPISRYFPPDIIEGLHVRKGVDRSNGITVRHVASHTSGLPDYFEGRAGGKSLAQLMRSGQDVGWSFEDVLRINRDLQQPHFEPQDLASQRQKARYSDTGFQLLIRLLETVTGQPFSELVQERICRQIGLSHTWLPKEERPDTASAPMPLSDKGRQLDLPQLIKTSNDLYSTTSDLITFQRALLAGELHRHRSTVDTLTERSNRLRNAPVLKYGLGTMYFTVNRLASAGRRPVTLIGHSGATGTWLFYCPELDVHVAGAVNQVKGQAIPFRIMARCLNIWRQ